MIKYGNEWYERTELEIELACIAQNAPHGVSLFDHFMEARRLAWPKRYRHEWTDLMYHNFIDNDVTVLMGCASCVSGNTKLLNPFTGKQTEISKLRDKGIRPLVMTLEGPELAGVPFIKGTACIYEVKLSDGKKFKATAQHRVLSPDGFVTVGALCVGQQLLAYDECHQWSNSDNDPSNQYLDADHWNEKAEGSQFDYRTDLRFCDEPLRPSQETFRCASPSQGGVRKPTSYALSNADGRAQEWIHNHGGLSAHHLSSCNDPSPVCCTAAFSISQSVSDIHQPETPSCQQPFLSPPRTTPNLAWKSPDYDFYRTETVHALMPCKKYRVVRVHISSIKMVGVDIFYDLEVPKAHHYFAEGCIHHNSQKTSHAVEFSLLNYWARPLNTLVVLSTINMDKLDIGVWAELQMLWKEGKDLHPYLNGNILSHKRAITTDNLEDKEGVRDFRVGCICRPCYVGGKFVGLGILAGLKQDHIIYVADELQFMQESFSKSWPHLFANGSVKIIGSGNPKHDPYDELGKTAEPKGGWNTHPEPQKTEVWETKLMGAKCVNLVGPDSPNFKLRTGQPEYKRLIGPKFAERIEHDNEAGKESFEYYRLVKGVMKVSFAKDRVINRPLCINHKAMETPVWKGTGKTSVYALDPTYGGEDRCVGIPLWFGMSDEGIEIVEIGPYKVFPLNMANIEKKSAEDQIADILAKELDAYTISPRDVFYDATGKGTIGAAFARKFGLEAPVAVDSGAMPTDRAVRDGLYVQEENGVARLKKCSEHYSKFVSEMWFSVRYAIEAEQVRGLPEDMMMEGCARIYKMTKGNKIEVEPKTDPKAAEDLKRRLGKSPDLFDALAIGVEGCRQRGFRIATLGSAVVSNREESWFEKESKEYQDAISERLLSHTRA